MDSSLATLPTSSGETSTATSESLLARMAKTVLEQEPGGRAEQIRQMAGLLALINLFGIVDAFYQAPQDKTSAADKSPPTPSGLEEPDPKVLALALNILSDFVRTREPENLSEAPDGEHLSQPRPPQPSGNPVSFGHRSGLNVHRPYTRFPRPRIAGNPEKPHRQ